MARKRILPFQWLFEALDRLRHRARKRRAAPHVVLAWRGEDLAHRFAERELGWRVVGRNYRHPVRRVEIDLIAIEDKTLVIAEIKTRSAGDESHPLRAVGDQKIRNIGFAARGWLRKAEELGLAVRFDVITIIDGWPERVEYFRDAFHLTELPYTTRNL